MVYTVGEMAKMLEVPASTLRYYDKEGAAAVRGALPGRHADVSGEGLQWLQVIGCPKKAGMPLRDIRVYIELAMQGDDTIGERLALFEHQREVLREQMEQLQRTMDVLDYKCWYYETAREAGRSAPCSSWTPRRSRSASAACAASCATRRQDKQKEKEKLHEFHLQNWKGTLLCLVIALPCWWLGKRFPHRGRAGVRHRERHDRHALHPRQEHTAERHHVRLKKGAAVRRDSARLRHEPLGHSADREAVAADHSRNEHGLARDCVTLHKLLHIPGKNFDAHRRRLVDLLRVSHRSHGSVASTPTEEVAQIIRHLLFQHARRAPVPDERRSASPEQRQAFGIFARTARPPSRRPPRRGTRCTPSGARRSTRP